MSVIWNSLLSQEGREVITLFQEHIRQLEVQVQCWMLHFIARFLCTLDELKAFRNILDTRFKNIWSDKVVILIMHVSRQKHIQ